jgi:hypothetical protein
MVMTWDIGPFGSRCPKGKLATFEEQKVFKAAYPLKSFSKGPLEIIPKFSPWSQEGWIRSKLLKQLVT